MINNCASYSNCYITTIIFFALIYAEESMLVIIYIYIYIEGERERGREREREREREVHQG